MPELQQKETVTVGGKNYIVEDLSEESKYIIAQLQDLSQQQANMRARLHQIDMAMQGFEKNLEVSVKETSNQPSEEPSLTEEHIVQ